MKNYPRSSNFIGRKNDIVFLTENIKDVDIFCIEGSSGIGKTAFIGECANKLKRKYEYIHYIQLDIHENIDRFILKLSEISCVKSSFNFDYIQSMSEDQKILYFSRSLKKMNILYIIDDFQYYTIDILKCIEVLSTSSGIKFIVSSNKYIEFDKNTISLYQKYILKPLTIYDTYDLFKSLCSLHEISINNVIDDMIVKMNGNPFLIKLLISFMLIENISCTANINESILKELYDQQFSQILIKLNENEKNFLGFLCFFTTSFDLDKAVEIFGDKKIYLSLKKYYLIEKISENTYKIHDILKKHVRTLFSKTYAKIFHKKIFKYYRNLNESSFLNYINSLFHLVNAENFSEAILFFKETILTLSIPFEYISQCRILLEKILLHCYDHDIAVQLIRLYLSKHYTYNKAKDLLKDLKTISNDEDAEKNMLYGILYIKKLELNKAEEYLDKGLSETQRKDLVLSIEYRLANVYRLKGDLKRSAKFLAICEKKFKKNKDINCQLDCVSTLAQIYYSSDIDLSLKFFKKAEKLLLKTQDLFMNAKILSQSAPVHLYFGNISKAVSNTKKAIKIYDQLKAFTEKFRNICHLAFLYSKQKKFKTSVDTINKAIYTAESMNMSKQLAQAIYYRGYIFEENRYFKEAIEQYEIAFKMYKKMNLKLLLFSLCSRLCKIYIKTENYKKAQCFFKEGQYFEKDLKVNKIISELYLNAIESNIAFYTRNDKYPSDFAIQDTDKYFTHIEKNINFNSNYRTGARFYYLYSLWNQLLHKNNKEQDKKFKLFISKLNDFQKNDLMKELVSYKKINVIKRRGKKVINYIMEEDEITKIYPEKYDIFFDVIHKKLIVNGIYINIFSKRSSVKVLEILLLKNAEVLSTEKIFEMIWTNKKVDNFKVVKTAIFRLRKIIECDHTKPLFIKTSVGNKGYYFNRDVSFCLITEK